MIFQKYLLVAFLSLCSVDAFMVVRNPTSSCVSSASLSPSFQGSTTSLFEKQKKKRSEDGGEAAEAETAAPAEEGEEIAAGDENTDAATDILNSPAFLTRKLEVLKSDIDKIEEEISEAKEVVEAGRAEWGDQLDKLQSEVSAFFL